VGCPGWWPGGSPVPAIRKRGSATVGPCRRRTGVPRCGMPARPWKVNRNNTLQSAPRHSCPSSTGSDGCGPALADRRDRWSARSSPGAPHRVWRVAVQRAGA